MQPPPISGFTGVAAQGVAGGDFSCPKSLLPDKCAFSSVDIAASTCIRMTTCGAVTVYVNGKWLGVGQAWAQVG